MRKRARRRLGASGKPDAPQMAASSKPDHLTADTRRYAQIKLYKNLTLTFFGL